MTSEGPGALPTVEFSDIKRRNARRALENPAAELAPVFRAIPGWSEVDAALVRVERISGAMTNLVFRCQSFQATRFSTVILRLFGPGNSLFSQTDEREIFLLAGSKGLGPRCLLEFEGGRVEEFLPGASLSARTMREPTVARLTASAMASFHALMTEERAKHFSGTIRASTPAIFRRTARWHEAVRRAAPAVLRELGLEAALDEVAALERLHAARFQLWLAFCHNDLQYGNMLLCAGEAPAYGAVGGTGDASPRAAAAPTLTPPPSPTATLATSCALGQSAGNTPSALAGGLWEAAAEGAAEALASDCDEEAARADGAGAAAPQHIRIIDYEYGTMNDVAYDVANHWCEYAADYHAEETHVLHFDRLPNREERAAFARAYVDALLDLRRLGAANPVLDAILGTGADPEALAALLVAKAEAYMPLSHLMWGLWGVLQAEAPDADFQYLDYARQRVAQYHASKQPFLAAVRGLQPA